MEKGAAGSPQGHTNPGISRYLASRLPYLTSSSEGGATRCYEWTCYDRFIGT